VALGPAYAFVGRRDISYRGVLPALVYAAFSFGGTFAGCVAGFGLGRLLTPGVRPEARLVVPVVFAGVAAFVLLSLVVADLWREDVARRRTPPRASTS
jgi:hypothetical protein